MPEHRRPPPPVTPRGRDRRAEPAADPTSWLAEQVTTARLALAQPSMAAAGDLIAEARRHLVSAGHIVDDDPVLGIGACHDAARKAITAHIRARGYRVTNNAGAHKIVIDYATIVLNDIISADDATELDYLRRDRHTAEYGDFASRTITPARVRQAIGLGARITTAVADTLAGKIRPT